MRPAGTRQRLVVGIDLVVGVIERDAEIVELAFLEPVGAAHPNRPGSKMPSFPPRPEVRSVRNRDIAVRGALPAAVTGKFKFPAIAEEKETPLSSRAQRMETWRSMGRIQFGVEDTPNRF